MTGQGPVGEVVLGARDPEATLTFLRAFGLVEVERLVLGAEVASAWFGAGEDDHVAVRVGAVDAPDRATVLVVATTGPAVTVEGWMHGPRALDLYTADLDRSIAELRAAGHEVSPEAVLAGGPMRMRQVLVRGPDGLPVVLVESTHRRSSICDLPTAPLHSEPHSVVWCVEDHEAELSRWIAAGWTAGATISFSEPSVSDELGLAERPTPITMTMLSDESVAPIRVELLTFDDHGPSGRSAVDVPQTGQLAAGLHALRLPVRSVDDAMAAWGEGATFGDVVRTDGGRGVAGTTGGGVRVLLTEHA